MKALSVICSIMITAVPSVLLAQNKPYPDFDSIAKTAQPAPQNDSSTPQNEPSAADHPKVTRPGPVTPSARMNAPYPPEKEGCHHLVAGKWQEVPCISEEHIQDFPPPKLANSIQSTPHGFIFFGHPGGYTSPLVWGSVAINNSLAITGPAGGTETDGTVNAFSIQTNTNYFNCSTCSSGKPFAAVTGVSNSASATGDQGWVQFVYQNYASSARLCVWNIDLTIAQNTNSAKLPGSSSTWGFANSGYAGYNAACVAVPTTYPLTGSGAANGEGEVIGYITSCPANSNSGCLLEVVGYLPWGGDQGWWSIGTKDAMGLSGNWTNVSGTILGSGGSSSATFTKTGIDQVLRAYSCFLAPSDATGFAPQPCPPPNPAWLGFLTDLSGTPAISSVTGESNNLTNGPVTFTCQDFDCWLEYKSQSPDCSSPLCN